MSEIDPSTNQEPDLKIESVHSRMDIYNLNDILSPERLETKTLFDAKINNVHILLEESNAYDQDMLRHIKLDLHLQVGEELPDGYAFRLLNDADQLFTNGHLQEQYIASAKRECNDDDTANPTIHIETYGGLDLYAHINYHTRKIHISNDAIINGDNGISVMPIDVDLMSAHDQLAEFGAVATVVMDAVTGSNEEEYRVYAANRVPTRGKPMITQLGALATTHSKDLVKREEVDQKPSVVVTPLLEDVVLENIAEQACRTIISSIKNKDILKKWGGRPAKGIILHGETGNGKTTLAHAISNEIGAVTRTIQSTDMQGELVGQSAKKLIQVFDTANESTAPYVILFDEIEGLLASGNQQVKESVEAMFRQELDALHDHVTVIATTNHLDNVSESLVRSGRFDEKIYIRNPDDACRTQLFSKIISQDLINLTVYDKGSETMLFQPYGEVDLQQLIAPTDGMSGAMIHEILRRAKVQKSTEEMHSATDSQPITTDDILRIIADIKTD